MEKLTIIMTTDKNYIMPTKVAIYTMLKYSSDDVAFDIHILCETTFDMISRQYLKKMEEQCSRISFFFDEIDISEIKNAKTHSYIPLASYYRLYISRFIKEDKCLFIDGDVIVRCNLKELFNIDIGDYYIAAVRDCAVQTGKKDFVNHEYELGIPSLDNYVNAGVMIFNLDRIRRDALDTSFIQAIGTGYRFMDQDILNKFCYGHVKIIPLKYNLFSEYYDRVYKMPENLYTREELEEAQRYPAIIHYPGPFKPWTCSRLKANKLWWKEAEEILTQQELQEWEKKARNFEQESDFSYLIGNLEGYEKIVIFGFSDIGKQLLDMLMERLPQKQFYFCDNDETKQGKQYREILVFSVSQIIDQEENFYWIIGSQNAYVPIKNQLLSFGVEDRKITRYLHKDSSYYDRLDDEFKEYEEAMIRG